VKLEREFIVIAACKQPGWLHTIDRQKAPIAHLLVGNGGFFCMAPGRQKQLLDFQQQKGFSLMETSSGKEVEGKLIFNAEEIRRALSRIAHEILERNANLSEVMLIGIYSRGVPIAQRLAAKISDLEHVTIPVGQLDITKHRDDLRLRGAERQPRSTSLPTDITNRTVILVDDVLYTGRTARAALDALVDYGRPRKVQLVVLVDRGHRELPIRADYVGKNMPTAREEQVHVRLAEYDGYDAVLLSQKEHPTPS
jgi:pyrimidine operon attenuation protein/uracil phosphoribosyltransferase